MAAITSNELLFSKYGQQAINVRKRSDYRSAMIDLGEIQRCRVPGVTTVNEDGLVSVVTHESPFLAYYPQHDHLIVCLAKTLPGKIYAYGMPQSELHNKSAYSVPVTALLHMDGVTNAMREGIAPILSRIKRAYWAKPEERKAIIVTNDMVNDCDLMAAGLANGRCLTVYNNWGESEDDVVIGDAVIIQDLNSGQGYHLDRKTFWATHHRAQPTFIS